MIKKIKNKAIDVTSDILSAKPRWKAKKAQKIFIPKNGVISIPTTSKMNRNREIINPTKKDIEEYNKRYTTIKVSQPIKNKLKK